MDADRRERAKSIRAARDWLAGAEHALAGEDDLAGDLKLMLAHAELARIASNRRARLRRWAGRLLPPLAAAVLLGWLAWDYTSAEENATPIAVQGMEARAETIAPMPEIQAAGTEDPHASTLTEKHPPPVTAPVERSAADRTVPQEQSVVTASAPPHTEAAPSAVLPRMPNADLQRLMQVGGKILRE